ncbi:MAG: DNA repair protein RadC [Tissierellia bacterium]|nr:DNA repair protein RadC [Tissierellia bacterium]
MKEDRHFKFMIKDIPVHERPQEKMICYGPEYLTNAELLALIIRTGHRNLSALDLSKQLLYSFKRDGEEDGLYALRNASLENLMKIKGIGEAKATMILAAITLGLRMSMYPIHKKRKITSPNILVDYVMNDMKYLDKEHFRIVILNTKKEIIYIREISKGTVNMTVVHPREVFKQAIEDGAHSIILLHNHPSGDPKPSTEDIQLTKRLKECSEIIGIPIVDHIIIGDNTYFSFVEEELLQ